MKTIILILLSFLSALNIKSAEVNKQNSVHNPTIDKAAVYEGTITALTTFYGMSTQGLTPGGYYINIDTYPDSDFEFTLKNGLKWGLVEEIAPGLVIVNSKKCNGWYVRLTVNNSMQVTKCKILSYGDETE